VKKVLFAVTLIAAFSLAALAQDTNAVAVLHSRGIQVKRGGPIQLSAPHACTYAPGHPCVYYAGDFNTGDANANGYANENTLLVSDTWTYGEVKSPVSASIHGSFGNTQPTLGDIFDPATAMWDYRSGVSEGNGGTSTGSGSGKAIFTATGRIPYGVYTEYEVLTATSTHVSAGDVFFSVQPQCTNSGDSNCPDAQYFTSTTDGTLDAINGNFTVAPDGTNATGPFLNSAYFGFTYANWCTDLGLCAEVGMSQGVLK